MCFHWRRWWHVPSSRIACSSDLFLKSGGYWEDLEPVGYEDLGAGKWEAGWGRQLGQRRRIGVSAEVGVGSFDFGCACGHRNLVGGLGWRLVPEDIAFITTLKRLGRVIRFLHKKVGGAISNCKTPGLSRNDTYEAACPPPHCARLPRARHERPHSTDARTTRHRKADAESNKGQDSRTAGAEPDTDTRLRNQTDHDSWKLFELFSRPRECSPCLIMERASASRFLNQDWLKKRRRCQRASMARLRAQRRHVPDQNPPQKRPAASGRATKKRPSSCMRDGAAPKKDSKRWRRPYPCCGQRRDRCRCNWGAVEARLDSSAWESMVGRVRQGELKYVVASVCVLGCVGRVR